MVVGGALRSRRTPALRAMPLVDARDCLRLSDGSSTALRPLSRLRSAQDDTFFSFGTPSEGLGALLRGRKGLRNVPVKCSTGEFHGFTEEVQKSDSAGDWPLCKSSASGRKVDLIMTRNRRFQPILVFRATGIGLFHGISPFRATELRRFHGIIASRATGIRGFHGMGGFWATGRGIYCGIRGFRATGKRRYQRIRGFRATGMGCYRRIRGSRATGQRVFRAADGSRMAGGRFFPTTGEAGCAGRERRRGGQ